MESHNYDQASQPPANQRERAVFDYDRSVARLGGDPVLFEEIVVLFLEDSPQLVRQARQARSERNLASLARAAHSLKNLTANFDASAATRAAATVEQHAQDGAWGHLDACLSDMERELQRLQQALRAWTTSGS
jgi:HPt (histidine-containing phosphotransfer) domain-containing protein